MTAQDTIINLVDRLLAEKEKNFMLQLQLNQLQNQQARDEKTNKD